MNEAPQEPRYTLPGKYNALDGPYAVVGVEDPLSASHSSRPLDRIVTKINTALVGAVTDDDIHFLACDHLSDAVADYVRTVLILWLQDHDMHYPDQEEFEQALEA